MKKGKRFYSLLLAVVMAIMCFGTTTAFAATPQEETTVEPRAALTTLVDQTFNMSGSHTGSTRMYNVSNMSFVCSFTDQNGNLLDSNTILAIRLYDATTGQLVREWQGSRSTVLSQTFYPNPNHSYYFQYIVAHGVTNLRVHMVIQTLR